MTQTTNPARPNLEAIRRCAAEIAGFYGSDLARRDVPELLAYIEHLEAQAPSPIPAAPIVLPALDEVVKTVLGRYMSAEKASAIADEMYVEWMQSGLEEESKSINPDSRGQA
jgi:hypothetical protein